MKPIASALIVFNNGRHTMELMSTKNLLHKSHGNNEQPKKGIGGGTIFFEDASLGFPLSRLFPPLTHLRISLTASSLALHLQNRTIFP